MQFNKYSSISYLLVLLLLNACCSRNYKLDKSNQLTQTCPEEWIQNRMPGPGTNFEEYFIIEGQRRELKEFDLEWVKKNCNIKPTIVQ
jgi:hypothetical protein